MLVLVTDPRFEAHDPGYGHPERPARLPAVLDGVRAGLAPDAVRAVDPRRATLTEIERVHAAEYLDRLRRFCEMGGGPLDPDTAVAPASWDAALYAAGSGIVAAEALERREGSAAFCAVRPPGHHAVASRAMGFCLINNVAVTAAHLRERGDRVLVFDWDAHHGNGTQDIFWSDPDVLFVSLHEWPQYPGTGAIDEVGHGPGTGTTVNFPLPSGATGNVYRDAIETVVAPLAEAFQPDWVLVSAGFDAHRADPLTDLGLSAGDYADLTHDVMALGPAGRTICFLEGGYDLEALRASVAATVSALLGAPVRPEPPTTDGPGLNVVRAAKDFHPDAC